MSKKEFKLIATVISDNPEAVEPVLKEMIGSKGTIKANIEGFEINAKLEGASAKELNRNLLSSMRRVEKKTRLRAEWKTRTTIERFFDYVPKGTRKTKN